MLEISCLLTASAFDCFIFFFCSVFVFVWFSSRARVLPAGIVFLIVCFFLLFFIVCVCVCVLCAESTVDSGVAGLEIPELTG